MKKNFSIRVDYLCRLINNQNLRSRFVSNYCELIRDVIEMQQIDSNFQFNVRIDAWFKVNQYVETCLIPEITSMESSSSNGVDLIDCYYASKNLPVYAHKRRRIVPDHPYKDALKNLFTKAKRYEICNEHRKAFGSYHSMYGHLRDYHPELFVFINNNNNNNENTNETDVDCLQMTNNQVIDLETEPETRINQEHDLLINDYLKVEINEDDAAA